MGKYKIGIFGSAADNSDSVSRKAKNLGKALAKQKCVVVTGGGSGLPHVVAMEASKGGAKTLGFSPEVDLKNQKLTYPEYDFSIYKDIVYTPKNFFLVENQLARRKYRNVVSTGICDAGIIISGRWGSLNEFTNLIDMGKVIGVLTSTGGIADELPRLVKKISKEGSGKVIFSNSPEKLIQLVIKELKNKNK